MHRHDGDHCQKPDLKSAAKYTHTDRDGESNYACDMAAKHTADISPSRHLPSVPLLNWNLGGVKIPIVAEAIIRMQTPFKMEDNGSP